MKLRVFLAIAGLAAAGVVAGGTGSKADVTYIVSWGASRLAETSGCGN